MDIDRQRLEESTRTIEAEKAVFGNTSTKVADVRAYLEGRSIDLSSVDDLSWVKTLRKILRTQPHNFKRKERRRWWRRASLA